MKIETERFGPLEFSPDDIIAFSSGIIGFPDESAFLLIRHGESGVLGWLQSASTPGLAFPVVSAHGLTTEYPDVPVDSAAAAAGIGGEVDDLAVLVVLSAPQGQPATVNLLAPIIVNSATRSGAQVFLEGSRFGTRELFVLPKPGEDREDREELEAVAATQEAATESGPQSPEADGTEADTPVAQGG